jgi:23S rRNA (adenine2503-C2)-methyltransferase
MDRERNLTHDEIFDQVVQLNKISEAEHKCRLTNIVFMGMGEPLLNYSNVIKAIDRISAPDGLVISPRRITVSTAGISKMIKKLADDNVRFRLALSLHSADDHKRSKLMPINQENNLASLTEALQYFWDKTGNRISFEYCMFEGVNDTLEDAKSLAALCRKFQLIHVNLIEYNKVQGVPYKGLSFEKMERFSKMLAESGVNATIRRSRGKDIDAACGQLANKN